ncbi:MAG: peptide transporter substrate-binding protein [Acidimicrobiales bacterium]|nr:peptide transporter substrate-binding protein [Acidimicrobiales bacterium]
MWEEPDPSAPTLGGAAVRALTFPQLFVAAPDGSWQPSLVVAGSDTLAADHRSVTFALVPGAAWSDGTAITASDLRRSADTRFVAGVDELSGGSVRVRFTGPLGPSAWHRLWSGTDSVGPPVPGVFGGPFVVASYTPGLEVVLRRNDHWYGRAAGPWLDEVRLVLVPDAITARQLLARRELDVVMPPAATVRTPQLRTIPGVSVAVAPAAATGWTVVLAVNPDKVSAVATRAALLATVDRAAFVRTLLAGEATIAESAAWPSSAGSPSASDVLPLGRADPIDLVGENEEPMTALLQRSMQQRARPAGGVLELRDAEADRVEGWVAGGSYGAAVVMRYDGPSVCWTCRFATRYRDLAAAADADVPGAIDRLEARLRDDAVFLPLWRPIAVTAWRAGLEGVRANGYALSGAWNAWEWWRGSEG